jgi:uncharacterized protein (DUF2345 family)
MISAVQAGDIDYRPTQVTRELLVNPKNQLITFAPLAPKTFGDANFTVTASSTSNLPVTFVSSDENIAFVNGNEITIKAGGTVNITARQTGNANYSAAPEVTQQLTINPATQLITFNTLPPFEFHESPYELQASASSQLPVRYTTSNENVAVIKDNILTFKNIGTVTITAYQDGNASYQSAPQVSRDLIILKGEQRITFDSIASKVFGEANFTLAASSSSGLPIEFESSDNAIASVNGNTVTIKAAGSAMITAHQNGNANYKAAPDSSRYLVIGKANQTITFNTLSAKTFGDDNFTLSATTSSSLPVTFISSDESIVMIQGNVVTIKASGAVKITASQQGNTNYNKANDVTRELLINKRTQSISFAISTKTFGDSDFILTASASSNLPVSFEALSDHIAVTGTSVKLLKPGRTGIKAMQVGDKNYTSSDLTRSFCVNPARPSITMQFNSQGVPVLTSSNENGNQWYYKGQVLEGETGKTLLTKTGGNYTVTSKVEDCISEASIPFTLVYTGTEDVFSEFNLSVFPNPAKDWIVLRMSASTDQSYSFKLKSIVGATVLEGVALSPGETPILLTGLSAGIYILNIYDKAHSYTIRLIKE